MPLKSDRIFDRLCLDEAGADGSKALGIVPCPDLDELQQKKKGTAAIDLRLGRWLLTLRQSRATLLEVKELSDDPPAMPFLTERLLGELRDVEASAQGPETEARRAALDRLTKGLNLDRLRYELEIDQLNRDADDPSRLAKYHFVPFGDRFILQPGDFVLGITFEWLKLPSDLAGFVTGKSKWGRRGLIVETAAGIHPGFCGCLTLEIGNVGPFRFL